MSTKPAYYPFGLKHNAYVPIRKDVKYEEQLVEKKEIKQIAPEEGKFKYKYNFKEWQDELGLQWYDYGARNYDPALGRWFNMDPQTESYSNWTPYNYTADNPILFIDPNGEDIYMFFYVSGYKKRNGEEDKDANSMFLQAALTKAYDFLNDDNISGDNDIMVINKIEDIGELKNSVEGIVDKYSDKYGKTRYFGIFSHAGLDGPSGSKEASNYSLGGNSKNQMSLEGWSKINFNWTDRYAAAAFYGCRTGMSRNNNKDDSFTTRLSGLNNFKNVWVYGQVNYTYPSLYANVRRPSEHQANGLFIEPTYMVARSKYMPPLMSYFIGHIFTKRIFHAEKNASKY